MSRFTLSVAVIVLSTFIVSGVALAKTTAPTRPAATTSAPAASTKSQPSAMDKAKDMTRKQWNAMKKKWAQEKDKWASCNKQSKDQKLSGPKSWTFIGKCMTS
jgi:uncharacterized membrane protein